MATLGDFGISDGGDGTLGSFGAAGDGTLGSFGVGEPVPVVPNELGSATITIAVTGSATITTSAGTATITSSAP